MIVSFELMLRPFLTILDHLETNYHVSNLFICTSAIFHILSLMQNINKRNQNWIKSASKGETSIETRQSTWCFTSTDLFRVHHIGIVGLLISAGPQKFGPGGMA